MDTGFYGNLILRVEFGLKLYLWYRSFSLIGSHSQEWFLDFKQL